MLKCWGNTCRVIYLYIDLSLLATPFTLHILMWAVHNIVSKMLEQYLMKVFVPIRCFCDGEPGSQEKHEVLSVCQWNGTCCCCWTLKTSVVFFRKLMKKLFYQSEKTEESQGGGFCQKPYSQYLRPHVINTGYTTHPWKEGFNVIRFRITAFHWIVLLSWMNEALEIWGVIHLTFLNLFFFFLPTQFLFISQSLSSLSRMFVTPQIDRHTGIVDG